MQVLKKIVSLLLVAAMISSLALVAFAADETGTATPNVVLEAYKADGSALGASESVKVGDTIKVKLKTTEALECVNMNIYVTYDSEVLEADKTNSKLGDIASRFMMKSANVATSNEDDVKQGLAVGTPVVLATLSNPTGNVSVDANTEWAEFAFTVKSVSDATKLQVVIKTASRLNGIDPEAISSLVPGDLTLSVAGGASDNISKFEANGSTEVYAKVGSRKMVKINYTTKDGTALAAEEVTWTSDNETVVSVSDASVLKKATATYVSFRVNPSSVGVAHVTGTIGNHSVTFTYKVFAELPVTIEITTESDLSMNVAPGKKIQMTAVTYPVTPAATSVWPEQAVWKSSNEAVATVDSNGLVTTVGAGKATITVTLMGGTITRELKNPDEVNVVVEGTGAKDVTADSKAAKGTDFIFKVKKESGYIYEVKITINGSEYSDATFVEAEDGIVTYTIPGTAITGMIVIEVTKDEAVNVTFENTNKAEIKVVKADGRTSLADGHDIVKKGADYVFKVNSFKRVYTLTVEVTENEQTKTYTEDIPVAGNSDTRLTHTITIPNVQGNLNIKLSCVANDDMVEVVVNPYVELDGKTVYIIATRTKEGYQQGIKLDTYDGYAMYTTDLYIGQFTSPLTGSGSTFLWLVTVDKDETFTKDEALRHLTYTNHRDPLDYNKTMPKPDGIGNDGDVNGSNLIDVNDAQLVYDIYKGAYQSFYMTNTYTKNDTHVDPNYGIGASMTKFLEADVNRDMKVDIHDAADIINLIK